MRPDVSPLAGIDPTLGAIDPALDALYDTERTASLGVDEYFARFDRESERLRFDFAFETLRYGSHERETLELARAAEGGAPLVVWIHGGYWRRGSRERYACCARPALEAGCAVALLGYPLAPEASLDRIVAAVRSGVEAALAQAERLGADPQRPILAGHSVGAQLAALTATRIPARAVVGFAGLYDLEPLLRTNVNATVAIERASAERNSPLRHPPLAPGELLAAVGGLESPAFHEQTARYVAAWRAWGGRAFSLGAPDADHFSLVLSLADRKSVPAQAFRRLCERVAARPQTSAGRRCP
ncbi:MAG: alpha/beta hydrolase [Vulcanimicrobiaceae bacterium]